MAEMFLSGGWTGMRNALLVQLLTGETEAARINAERMFQSLKKTKDAGQARWLVRIFVLLPDLVNQDNKEVLLRAAQISGTAWAELLTAAIHYRLGELDKAEALLTAPNLRVSTWLSAYVNAAITGRISP